MSDDSSASDSSGERKSTKSQHTKFVKASSRATRSTRNKSPAKEPVKSKQSDEGRDKELLTDRKSSSEKTSPTRSQTTSDILRKKHIDSDSDSDSDSDKELDRFRTTPVLPLRNPNAITDPSVPRAIYGSIDIVDVAKYCAENGKPRFPKGPFSCRGCGIEFTQARLKKGFIILGETKDGALTYDKDKLETPLGMTHGLVCSLLFAKRDYPDRGLQSLMDESVMDHNSPVTRAPPLPLEALARYNFGVGLSDDEWLDQNDDRNRQWLLIPFRYYREYNEFEDGKKPLANRLIMTQSKYVEPSGRIPLAPVGGVTSIQSTIDGGRPNITMSSQPPVIVIDTRLGNGQLASGSIATDGMGILHTRAAFGTESKGGTVLPAVSIETLSATTDTKLATAALPSSMSPPSKDDLKDPKSESNKKKTDDKSSDTENDNKVRKSSSRWRSPSRSRSRTSSTESDSDDNKTDGKSKRHKRSETPLQRKSSEQNAHSGSESADTGSD